MKPATIIGWTGKGRLEDLISSARGSLVAARLEGVRLTGVGKSLVCRGVDPIRVSWTLSRLPGVSWVAIGYEIPNGIAGSNKAATLLARRYLTRGGTFRVSASADNSNLSEGDIVLAVTSTILAAVKGARVEENKPKVRFRITLSDEGGACGVQIRDGVGGVPASKKRTVYCLVSGGRHSSAAAWIAARAGFALRLVHLRGDDGSLRQVAKLYSELSQRMNPADLSIELVEGEGEARPTLPSWLRKAERLPVVVGTHLECDEKALSSFAKAVPRLLYPVILLQEEEVMSLNRDLGMREPDTRPSRIRLQDSGRASKLHVKRLKGKRTDMHAVLDNLLS